MNTNHTRKIRVTVAIAGAAAPTRMFLSTVTAQAIQVVDERSPVAILDDLKTPRDRGMRGGFNPQPDPPGFPDDGSTVGNIIINGEPGIGNPNDRPSQTVDPTNPNFVTGPHVKGVN